MTKTMLEVLEMAWEQQADHLRALSRKELEVLWFQLQSHGGSIGLLNMAVYSILRDLYESEGRKTAVTDVISKGNAMPELRALQDGRVGPYPSEGRFELGLKSGSHA